jgi:Ca-activated chloride channel family protein
MPEAFHFLQPLWFWALLPALLLLWLLRKSDATETAWRRVCDAGLLPYLLTRPGTRTSQLPLWMLGTGWLLAVIALADPVWEKQPQPVFRNEAARVVVLDLSNSMLSPDLKPSRMVRARYKVADILNQDLDGQTGLVVFAGNAFVVTPLTSDVETIRALLSPLEPNLMPAQGSRVDLGLQKAGHLLRQAGLRRGDILLVTDGYDGQRAIDAATKLKQQGYRVSVLGVGTAAGAPIPVSGGGFLRDSRGDIVLPALDQQALQTLATAGGGHYATISNSEADIKRLLLQSAPALDEVVASNDRSTDVWQSHGPLIVLLLLPLAALAFRRGWLLLVLVTVSASLSMPQPAMALGWDDLWLRADQQAARALQAGDPEQAAQLADDPALRGTAAYQAGDYEQAAAAFTGSVGSDADYNQGNALAKLERYEAAIAAYDRALAKQPGMTDAVHNKAEVEKLLQQQEQQQEQQKDQQDKNDQQDQQNQQGKQEQEDEGGEQGADQQQSADGSQGDSGEQEEEQDASAAEQGEQQDESAGEQQQSADAEEADAAEKERQPAQQEAGDKGEQGDQQAQAAAANPLDSEEQQAAEQWLRRIPDDPGGLLRRKFLYQYRQQAQDVAADNQQAW